MKRAGLRQRGKRGLELIEEAVHLLRMAPGAALAGYYIGSLPFVLGLLYFWADMSRSPFAYEHLAGAALGLALLFLWMKVWQARFASSLRAQITSEVQPPWNARRWWRVFIIQAALQPSGLFVLPVTLLPAVPFAWAYAFYQNVTVQSDGETGEIKTVFNRAYKQSFLWPGQNHVILLALGAFAFCVFLNLATVCLVLPQLSKMLLGIESVYTKSPFSLLNTTFFTAIYGLTYLCVDPISKTVFLLRCFYGESVQSGEDLKAELKAFRLRAAAKTAGVLLFLALLWCGPANAADVSSGPISQPAAPAPGISGPKLDQAIEDVIHQPKYTWRMPREQTAPDKPASKGLVARFFDNVFRTLKHWIVATLKWVGDALDRWFRRRAAHAGGGGSGVNWIGALQALFFVLLAVLAGLLAVVLCRVWQRRRKTAPVSSEAIFPTPDIADENVGAEQLPEDGWIKLGRELLERGEFRLALRAFYFATLAHLAARNLIAIAKFKSNRDYERELCRRGHSLPDLLSLFGESVSVFDRSWYGLHEVDRDLVNQFAGNVERIKAAG
jgi:hypothetical protein